MLYATQISFAWANKHSASANNRIQLIDYQYIMQCTIESKKKQSNFDNIDNQHIKRKGIIKHCINLS